MGEIPNEPPWVVEIDGIKFATPESVVLLLKQVSEERDELEAENERLREWLNEPPQEIATQDTIGEAR